MQIYELEVSNFKCLDNYGMPLRFSNLNIFIGENDAGKSALLEAIQVLFDSKSVNKSDFYDKEKDIKLRARLKDLDKTIIRNAMDKRGMYENGIGALNPFGSLEFLKKYSFYNDLFNFCNSYLTDFTVTIERNFKLNDGKIALEKDIYFSYPIPQNKYLNNLKNNKDFINFMDGSNKLSKIDFIDSILDPDPENDIVDNLRRIINSQNDPTIGWDNPEALGRGEYLSRGLELPLNISNPHIYFFGNEVMDYKSLCKKIYKDLFEEIFYKDSIKDYDYLSEIYDYLNNALNQFLLKKINSLKEVNFFADKANEINNLLNQLNDQNSNLNINLSLKQFEEIKSSLEPSLIITSIEGNREVDASKKSQGFLRKLFICSFLSLTKQRDIINYEPANKIILVEEPEIHMHNEAQKKVISILKENLVVSNSQVFITTHSQSIIEDINFENIFVFYKDKNSGITRVTNSSQYSDHASILFELQQSLGLSKMQLLNYKKVVVLVEGIRDILFIESLCKKPELKINIERILFIPVNGQEKMDHYIKSDLITNYLGFKILVILDNNEINKKRKQILLENADVIDVILIDKQDILDYIDIGIVEDHYNVKRGTLKYNKNIDKLEEIVKNYLRKKISSEDIEKMVLMIKDIPADLKMIIDKIKFIQDTYVDFNFGDLS